MAGNRRLTIEILGDAKGLAGAFGQAEGQVSRFARGIGGAAKTAGLAVAGIAGAAVLAAPKVLEMGTQLDALGKKASTVFGSSLGEVEAWAEATAGSMGLTADQAVGVAAGLGDLLKPMGFTAEQAAAMSTDMLDLSGALSAWTGGAIDAAGVSDILTKAMLGERDGLKQLGISISEADVQARLLEKGQQDLTGAALEQAKALATQELILEKSTDAQTAWEDGTMDAIKAQNEAKASIDEVKEGLVKALFPALQAAVPYVAKAAQWLGDKMPGAMAVAQSFVEDKLVPAFQDYLIPAFQAVAGWVQQHWPQISEVITTAMETVQEVITTVVDFVMAFWDRFGTHITNVIQRVFPPLVQIIQGAVNGILGVVQFFTAVLQGDWSAAWDAIKRVVAGAWDVISGIVAIGLGIVKTTFEVGWDLVKSAVDTALGALETIWDETFGRLLDPIQWVIDKVQELIGWVNDGIDRLNILNGGFQGGGALVEVAGQTTSGGGSPNPVPGARSRPMAIMPRSAQFGGGGPIHITLEVDRRVLSRAVIDDWNRRGGAPARIRAAGV